MEASRSHSRDAMPDTGQDRSYNAITWSSIRRFSHQTRFSSLRGTRTKHAVACLLFLVCGTLFFFNGSSRPSSLPVRTGSEVHVPSNVFEVVEKSTRLNPSRKTADIVTIASAEDTFASYKHRKDCDVSSQDLHTPFTPICPDRPSMITAMSSGGRIGMDAPYMPRGCGMRWFNSEEVCEILSRFDKVVIVGDSMMRHVVGSINILVRKDIGYGAVTDWNFSAQEKKQCFCNEQFDVKACSVQGIYKTSDVESHDPSSISCAKPINVLMEEIIRVPIPPDELRRLKADILPETNKPTAVIFGHGLWNNLDVSMTLQWLDIIAEAITHVIGSRWSGLFVTPNAAGKQKADEWLVSQGNKALMVFEEEVGMGARRRGIENLGTWNMSIQASKYDGVHLDMKGNLVKAMMVMNWLNLLEV
ncbi:hypothetical protein BP5796_13193 [Coleophoma crateriformis]|uniref:Uncharacterized protein n=1 Tax=Coleophoma crateriformis TaxID=565419 RepID=A0A3D8Q4W8_9HELO|nr:hypothetical protein BP5796_13193 [Coleophoma crateriformis]